MKIIKKLSPIMESISNVGKKKPLKEGFYEGGFPDFEAFMDVVYEGNTYGDYDVEFPHFSKTIDLIDSIWKEKYSDKETWDQIPFTADEKDEIFKSAQNEAKSWDNMDLYNSHARYNPVGIREIKKAIRDAFNVENKYLHENLKKKIDEEFDVNHPIGVLPHADAVAMEQHIADRAAGLERRANPDKDPLVKELIEETASEKSRTLHYDVVDRKGLAKILTEAKKNKCEFKVGRNNKAGYRYFVDILPIYGSKGALEVDDEATEVDGEALTECLLKEDIEKEIKDYIKWCQDNKKEAKDYKSLKDYIGQAKSLKEATYKLSMFDTPEYINALYKAYKALSNRKTGYAAVYGYRKGKTFTPVTPPAIKDDFQSLKEFTKALNSKPNGQTDVQIYTIYKDKLDDVKELLKEKGLLKEEKKAELDKISKFREKLNLKEDYDDFDYYVEQLEELGLDETEFDYYLEKLYEIADEDEYASYKSFAAVLRDARATAEDDSNMIDDEDENLDEDLQLYASSLKDFKPAKEAEELWNEIIEKGKLDDLEYELENVFKADDGENTSIDIEGLNDLLVNHQDFIRTLIGLDDAPLKDDDYDEEPVGENEMVYYEDDEEPVDEDAPIEADEDDIDVDEIEGVDEGDEDDIEPIYGDEEERKTPTKWKKIESDEDDKTEEDEPKDKTDKSETEEDKKEKKEEKVEESLDKKEPEIKLDDEEDDLEECDKNLKECGPSKDDDLTESIAKGFVKSNFTEAKDMSGMSDEEKRQELARKSLASLNESDEEVVEIDDKELTEALGMPTEDQAKKEEPKKEEAKPEEVKEESKENKNEEIK